MQLFPVKMSHVPILSLIFTELYFFPKDKTLHLQSACSQKLFLFLYSVFHIAILIAQL